MAEEISSAMFCVCICYKKQVRFPIVECGARRCAFYQSHGDGF